jgi:hypothetical protein
LAIPSVADVDSATILSVATSDWGRVSSTQPVRLRAQIAMLAELPKYLNIFFIFILYPLSLEC